MTYLTSVSPRYFMLGLSALCAMVVLNVGTSLYVVASEMRRKPEVL